MPTVKTQFVLFLALGLLDLSGTASTSATQRHAKAKTPVKQEDPAPQPLQTPPPLALAQMPASPPQVAYSNGSLTIVARNSTLGDILRAVHSQTGAVMEISGSATERVVSSFGPGTPRDVLAQLLNGSNFNYVILGSPVDAGMVQRVVLTPKLAGDEETQAQNAPNPAVPKSPSSVQPLAQSSQHMADDDSDDSSDADAQDDQPTPVAGSEQPVNQQGNQQPPKTPEQLLQELQRQQQLQQQQQQGDNPSPNQR